MALALPLGEQEFLELLQYHYRMLHSEDDFDFDTDIDSSSRRLGSEPGGYLSLNILEDIYMGLSWVEFSADDSFSELRNNKSNLFSVEFEYEFW